MHQGFPSIAGERVYRESANYGRQRNAWVEGARSGGLCKFLSNNSNSSKPNSSNLPSKLLTSEHFLHSINKISRKPRRLDSAENSTSWPKKNAHLKEADSLSSSAEVNAKLKHGALYGNSPLENKSEGEPTDFLVEVFSSDRKNSQSPPSDEKPPEII